MRILGIDPGLAATGFGVIEQNHSSFAVVDYGVINMRDQGIDITGQLWRGVAQIHEAVQHNFVRVSATVVDDKIGLIGSCVSTRQTEFILGSGIGSCDRKLDVRIRGTQD